jgi:bifunctional non-homologous end joining protein LigD
LPFLAGCVRGKLRVNARIVFYAFDSLHLNADNLTQKPLIERKTVLKRILPKPPTGSIRYTEHIAGDAERLFRELEARQLEGMVASAATVFYISGRTRAWLKIKTKAGKVSTCILGASRPAS